MELTMTPTSSPASSPIPIPQEESPCFSRRKFAMEMEVLNLKIISQTNWETSKGTHNGAPKKSESEYHAQNEARYYKKHPFKKPSQYNRQGNNLAQPTDLLFILADLLNKFPGLAQQLPRITAVKNNRNQKYAIIEELLDSETYV
ncbi:hypothetical protein NPIL_541771 [Nephila pilipes]|uniref:Uncharacterized protein n=1 Tax=Nephila pilipes TaxID=299642 RepID=A0A8X6PG27_NEPPI|nr:hypothetical protein NPIL_541771 [Nephila pilipes]